ncbi:DUF6077 domain-containing protein [Spirillospora sp. CA-294931]|uniref:DUF6077 domain-containing protein n=1 Tax=Spirillospora sp. CA-294931 TaxID=3240042 RepID=UPI003D8F5A75
MVQLRGRAVRAEQAETPEDGHAVPWWPTGAMDRLTDGIVVAFALWTLIYHLGLVLKPPTWGLLAGWVVATLLIAVVFLRKRPGTRPLWPETPRWTATRLPLAVPLVSIAAGAGAGVCAGLRNEGVPWWLTCVLAVASVATAAYGVLRARGTARGESAPEDPEPGGPAVRPWEYRWGSLVALVTGAGFAVASLFIVNSDGDDTYFVSRSVATAATGEIPLRDVIFTSGKTGGLSGEPPVSSIEVLVGALARLTGLHATSFLYYLALPAVTFLSLWTVWRLVRTWAPRNALACYAVAAVFLLWGGLGQAAMASFHMSRMWQGKAMFLSALIPLLYVYLTRWAERRSASALALLAAGGVAAVGLTSTATMIVPLITVAAAAPLVVSGRLRTGAAALALMAYPIAAGLAVVVLGSKVAVHGAIQNGEVSYSWVLLSGTLGIMAGLALWLSPWTARRGVPALVTTGVAAVATLVFLPGVMELLTDITDAGQVMWRLTWVVPVPVFIGLLAGVRVPLPRLPRAGLALVPLVPAAVLATVLIVGGAPVWTKTNGSTLADRPSWKTSSVVGLSASRALLRRTGGRGVLLMPQSYMRTVPLLTAKAHAVNPSTHYLKLIPGPASFIDDRILLTELVDAPKGRKPDAARVRDALRRVGVTAACTRRGDKEALATLEEAGYGGRVRVKTLNCVFPGR